MTDNNENLENLENLEETQESQNDSENLENVLDVSEGSEMPDLTPPVQPEIPEDSENQDSENGSNDSETIQEPEYQEPEPQPNPWDDAPTGVYFYEKMYPDGHLGSFTESAELAYKSGWDLSNFIAIEDTQQSDINGWTYRKDLCPMKTEQDLLKDQYHLEITQLKKQLSDTDYKAIKFAEGQISDDEYAVIKAERQGYRDRINYLEGLM